MAINKVVYDGTTLIDLSSDTLSSADQLMQGIVAHDRTGAVITGTILDGNLLEYGITDGSIPLVGIAKAGYAPAWSDSMVMMALGTGTIGTGRVV